MIFSVRHAERVEYVGVHYAHFALPDTGGSERKTVVWGSMRPTTARTR